MRCLEEGSFVVPGRSEEIKFSLDLWEQRLAQAVEKQYPEEFRKMVIDVAVAED